MVGEDGLLQKAEDSSRIIGIVSSQPGIVLEGTLAQFGGSGFRSDTAYEVGSRAPIALAGRVPVKVNLEGGDIKAGDRIALSSVPGVGTKATSSGMTVGIALEEFSDIEIGKILVFVNLGYSKLDDLSQLSNVNGQMSETNGWSVDQTSGRVNVNFFGAVDLNGNEIINVSKILSANGKWSINEEGHLIAKKITTEELEVVGSAEKPSGITLYDEDTGEPYCLKIKSGAMVSIAGVCGAPPQSAQAGSDPAMSPEPALESEPEPASEPEPPLESSPITGQAEPAPEPEPEPEPEPPAEPEPESVIEPPAQNEV